MRVGTVFGVRARRAAAVIGVLLLPGCATFSDSLGVLERNLALNQPASALAALERQGHGRGDEALYLLNKAMLLRMDGRPAESNAAFEAAKQRIAALSAVSVSEQAASFVINDATRAYAGEPFEQVLIHLYMALNYLELGEADAARVEALQVDLRLRELADRLPQRRYQEDALARYLTGKIYEERGEWSDAMIAYRKAYEAYGEYRDKYGVAPPRFLGRDLQLAAARQGLTEELARYRRAFAPAARPAANEGGGELLFLLHNGLAPMKREQAVTVINPHNGRLIRISQPRYERRASPVASARIRIGQETYVTELAEDIDAIAVKELEAQMPAITARAIARAVAKDRTAKEAGKQEAALGLVVNIANVLTERADTRSWTTLPANIHLAAVPLPAGRYEAVVELLDARGQVVATRSFPEIVIADGRKTWLSYHWIPPGLAVRR